MNGNEDAQSEVEVPNAIDPYEVLGLAIDATEGDVKKAYRKAALKNHPDKVPAERKEEANSAFQKIAFAYAILSNPGRRKLYDETGSVEESVSIDPDWSWSDFYRAQFADVITSDAIAVFAAKYKGSDEERDDLLRAYTQSKGNMDTVYEEVMLSDFRQDDERFRAIIDEAIELGEVDSYATYRNENSVKRERRRCKINKEAREAKELAMKLGVHDKLFGGHAFGDDGTNDPPQMLGSKKTRKTNVSTKAKVSNANLAALIQSRQGDRTRQDIFLDQLAEKYGAKVSKKGKTCANIDEPPEDAFRATAARLNASRQAKRKVNNEEPELEMRAKKAVRRPAK